MGEDRDSSDSSSPLEKLARGEQTIYQAIQLWDYRSKQKADDFETAVIKGVVNAASSQGLTVDKFPAFMPFRDSDEDEIQSDDKAKVIYDADMDRLADKTFAIIGFNEGLAKDSGECFEYGRAAALDIPSILTISDFEYFSNRYKDVENQESILTYPIDPVVMAGVGKVLVLNEIPSLGEETVPTSRDFATEMAKKVQFRDRLDAGARKMYDVVAKETENLCLDREAYIRDIPMPDANAESDGKTVYLALEGLYEWQREKMDEMQAKLEADGFTVYRSQRFDADTQRDFVAQYGSEQAVYELGRADLEKVAKADIVITLGDGADMPAGPSFIQGYARTTDKKVITYYTGNAQVDAHGGTQMLVNLMLEYSADRIARDTDEVIEYAREFAGM